MLEFHLECFVLIYVHQISQVAVVTYARVCLCVSCCRRHYFEDMHHYLFILTIFPSPHPPLPFRASRAFHRATINQHKTAVSRCADSLRGTEKLFSLFRCGTTKLFQ